MGLLVASAVVAQNSTRKIRPQPGPLAQRVGSAIVWQADLDTALAAASRLQRPVLWYVPTVPGSPMDRKPEIDRYMRAGPFSWPWLIELIGQRFVALDAVPSREQGKARDLGRGKFIEPGLLVLDADGNELLRCAGICTLSPSWWLARLSEALGEDLSTDRFGDFAWAFARGDSSTLEELASAARVGDDDARRARSLFWIGYDRLRQRRYEESRASWEALQTRYPDHPLAWKVAAEMEGHGPLLRGFEVWGEVPARAVGSNTGSTLAVPGCYSAAELCTRSVAFLCEQQDEDGLWRDSTYDFGGTDSLPNVYTAVSALCGTALLAWREQAPEAVDAALARLVERLFESDVIAPSDRDEIVWAHAYRLRFLCRALRDAPQLVPQARARAEEMVNALVALQEENGAWFHEYSNPFVVATVLLALHDAESSGLAVKSEPLSRGVGALRRCRAENGGFPYGMARRPRKKVAHAGAAGRMPLCELALFHNGASDTQRLADALEAAFEHHDLLAAVRRYDDHADRYGYGGFFFFYDLRARSEAIAALPADHARREAFRDTQRAQVLALPECDGCFVDSHELGRCYGTAMALLCLDALRTE